MLSLNSTDSQIKLYRNEKNYPLRAKDARDLRSEVFHLDVCPKLWDIERNPRTIQGRLTSWRWSRSCRTPWSRWTSHPWCRCLQTFPPSSGSGSGSNLWGRRSSGRGPIASFHRSRRCWKQKLLLHTSGWFFFTFSHQTSKIKTFVECWSIFVDPYPTQLLVRCFLFNFFVPIFTEIVSETMEIIFSHRERTLQLKNKKPVQLETNFCPSSLHLITILSFTIAG